MAGAKAAAGSVTPFEKDIVLIAADVKSIADAIGKLDWGAFGNTMNQIGGVINKIAGWINTQNAKAPTGDARNAGLEGWVAGNGNPGGGLLTIDSAAQKTTDLISAITNSGVSTTTTIVDVQSKSDIKFKLLMDAVNANNSKLNSTLAGLPSQIRDAVAQSQRWR
jgi:hypothetical protein